VRKIGKEVIDGIPYMSLSLRRKGGESSDELPNYGGEVFNKEKGASKHHAQSQREKRRKSGLSRTCITKWTYLGEGGGGKNVRRHQEEVLRLDEGLSKTFAVRENKGWRPNGGGKIISEWVETGLNKKNAGSCRS